MSKHCPITHQHCSDPHCEGNVCIRDRGNQREEFEKRLYHYYEQNNGMLESFLKIIEEQLALIRHLAEPEEHHHRKHQRVEQVLYFIFNNNKYIIMALSIASNQSAPIILGLIDSDTKLPVTATFVGETETSDNTSVATIDPVLGLVAVKTNTTGGTGNLTSVATWTYTDSKTLLPVTVAKTTVTPFTITPVVTAENVEMVVTLGTPVTQP